MLHVIEDFAKCFKVTQGHSKWHPWVRWCKSLSIVHCYCVFILYRLWDIRRQVMAWPWNLSYWSFKVIENGTIRKLRYFTFHNIYRLVLYHLRHNARYWPKIAIFHSRCIRRISAILDFRGPIMGSLKSPCTTFYRSSIETIAVNCLVFEKIAFLHFGDRQTNIAGNRMPPPLSEVN